MMGKTNLSLDDIEEIKKSKGLCRRSIISAGADYKKIWNAAPANATPANTPLTRITKPTENKEIERFVPQDTIQQDHIPHREIVVEDFYARLGRIEATMERQREFMQNILEHLDDMADVESNTQSNLENKESSTLRDIEKNMRESIEFVKTLGYCTIAGITVWQLLCKTREHVNKSTAPVSTTASTTSVPATSAATTAMSTTPASNPTRPSLFKKKTDVFEMP